MKVIYSRMAVFLLLIFLAAQFSGCAAGWFAGGAATGAVVTHEYDEHHMK